MTGDSSAAGTSDDGGRAPGPEPDVAPAPAPATPPDLAPAPASRRRPGGRAVGLVLWVLGGVVLAMTLVRAVPYDGVTPLAQVVGATPWVVPLTLLVAAAALALRRRLLATLCGVALAAQVVWVAPFVVPGPGVDGIEAGAQGTLRVLTVNAYFGQADAAAVVQMVRDQDADVLAVVELTADFHDRLEAAGIEAVMPHHVDAKVGTGSPGSGLWSRTVLSDPDTSEWSTFAMPAATVDVDGTPVRVTAVHPVPPLPEITGVWHQEMADLARRAHDEPLAQVLLGDFNATYDHASFRAVLGDRFRDATRTAGHGLNLSWPVGERVPTFLDLDHVVVEAGMRVDDVDSLVVPGSDHRALAVTVQVAP
ncbi:endonuclease/exonuclease/phosphatase family protein [Oerskovia paurometabola]|uniref:Endonuclease/exonuclease/phosphatase family protein n=1 Tax=Oerskovia paurometabola TaxID=162170 RepID=A0ABW1X543_9CELL|nr:endonuclease/exonuclease/phosphatase family protein [Oerskovia paurometabola]MBM7495953.1 endonuclease/exonuclease/phosphatase (EEP) superfamily protein YafD [Oerskovia paurometabola]